MVSTIKSFLVSSCSSCVFVLLLTGLGVSSAHAQARIPGCTVISTPGSYLLINNITVTPKDLKSVGGSFPACILITADSVTLDLGGFTISPSSGTFIDAFAVYASNGNNGTHGVLIKNGSITDFRSSRGVGRGVSVEGFADAVENVNVLRNDAGVLFDGGFNSATNVRATSNSSYGFLCFGGGVSVRDSEASNNGSDGINLLNCSGNSVVGNRARQNAGTGITVTCPSLVIENVAAQNATGDIVTNPSASCTLANNNPAP